MKTVLLFPGQGSQTQGMGVTLASENRCAAEVFEAASDIVGFDILDKCANAPIEELSSTIVAQPALMAVSLASAYVIRDRGAEIEAAAGHSLGEFPAMVFTGIVSLEDGFRLIKARSEAMQRAAESSDGVMYAVIGADAADIERVCGETEGYVVPVNYNSAVQTVIAGEAAAAETAAGVLAGMGARTVKLNVASAFHSKIMQPAADEFLPFAGTISYNMPSVTMLSNITGKPVDSVDDMGSRLAQHIVSPVRFTDELSWLSDNGFDTFVECGPGKTLIGLAKKTLKGITCCDYQSFISRE